MSFVCLVFALFLYSDLSAQTDKFQQRTSYGAEIDRITYLTENIDSLERAWTKAGHTLLKTGPGSRSLALASGIRFEFSGILPEIEDSWRTDFIRAYRSRTASLWLRVDDLDAVRRRLAA